MAKRKPNRDEDLASKPKIKEQLEDLFVEPSERGSGAGRALIAAVEAVSRKAGASRLYWMTEENNRTAQQLYDKLAERPGFVQYRKML